MQELSSFFIVKIGAHFVLSRRADEHDISFVLTENPLAALHYDTRGEAVDVAAELDGTVNIVATTMVPDVQA